MWQQIGMRILAGFVLFIALSMALPIHAEPATPTCTPGTTVPLRGIGPKRSALLLRFGERYVGGGTTDSSGVYDLFLQIGDERPGEYLVTVEVRGTRQIVDSVTCIVPRPGEVLPTATADITESAATSAEDDDCDPSYPEICIPPPPPDLNCLDISFRDFRVVEPDPHNFDGDKDGIGCESQ